MGVPDRRVSFKEPAWDWKNKENHWKEGTDGIVAREDADSRSMGHKILISEAVVFRDR